MLPHSIVTVSIVTAYFTRMSSHVRDGRLDSLRTDLSSALRSTLLIMVFAVVGLAVLSYSFSAVFGNDYAETSSIAGVYLAFLTGLIPFTVFFVLLRVFYALDRTRAAFLIQVVQTAFYVVGAYLAVVVVATTGNFWAGIVAGALVAALLGLGLERGLLRRVRGREMPEVLITVGVSFVVADLALAVVDEIEKPAHHRARFTAAH